VNVSNIRYVVGLSALLTFAPIADAQRDSIGAFEGNWKGTLTMDVMVDVPPEHLERLSKPVELEIRIFNRGGAELYFTFEEDEWEFSQQRNFRITPIGEQNGVIIARLPGNVGWNSSVSLNLTLQGEDSLFLSWSRLTVRDQLLNDGLDEYGFSGTATLNRAAEE
jgi:hypothetical protein